MTTDTVRRAFVDVAGGQVHMRTAGSRDTPPLVMLHGSTVSSKQLEPLIAALASDHFVLALDSAGAGDTRVAMPDQPRVAFYAEVALRAVDALGVGAFDLYGTHTGGCIAVEIAAAHASRVRRLIVDGISVYSAEQQEEFLAAYAPAIRPDLEGTYLTWAWHFARDAFLFFPWYDRRPETTRKVGLPDPDVVHSRFVELIKNIENYHHGYRAAFAYDRDSRFAAVDAPTLVTCARTDFAYRHLETVVAMFPDATGIATSGIGTPQTAAETAALLTGFLRAERAG